MQHAVRRVLSKYATFSGRASRPEFWWWSLFTVILLTISGLIDRLIVVPALGLSVTDAETSRPLSALLALAILLPNLSVAVRRLHDSNRAGWWLLLLLIPILGTLVLLYFYLQPSDKGRNGYGDPDPLPR